MHHKVLMLNQQISQQVWRIRQLGLRSQGLQRGEGPTGIVSAELAACELHPWSLPFFLAPADADEKFNISRIIINTDC